MLRELEVLSEKMKVGRSELIMRHLDSALREKRVEEAVRVLREGIVTLWKAAEMTDFSLREIMDLVREKKMPLTYTLDDLRRDIEYVQQQASGE